MLKTAIVFQNHMVLQREKRIAVWGTVNPGAQVTVAIQGQTVTATADADGNWKVFCNPLTTSFSEEMRITSGKETIVLRDVAVGEVWLAGGQSNMEFHMRYDADMAMEKEICANDEIRFFDHPKVSYTDQIDEADYGKHYGFWRKAEPEQLERFSAVGYHFAKELQNRYGVPVGIIGCNWGGTPACAWMSREAILEGGGKIYLDEYDEAVRDLDLEKYEEQFRKNPESYVTDQLGIPTNDLMMFGCTTEEFVAKMMEMGIDLSQIDLLEITPQVGPKCERRPSGLYESMLKPIAPYTFRGVIWYQGETDGDCHPEIYRTLFPALIRNWRQLWKEEFPFLFVQIAPLEQWGNCKGERYVKIRAAQQYTVDTVPCTGMAVISDIGMQYDIHPKMKQPVGHRLALLAEHMVYGENVLCEAPTLIKAEAEDGRLVLTFDYTGDGLYLSESLPHGQIVEKNRLGGLQVFQAGAEIPADSLEAEAVGNQVFVYGSSIRAGVSTRVKLADTGWYQMNLYNSVGIPARPAQKDSDVSPLP